MTRCGDGRDWSKTSLGRSDGSCRPWAPLRAALKSIIVLWGPEDRPAIRRRIADASGCATRCLDGVSSKPL
jgi:hypothetical protein